METDGWTDRGKEHKRGDGNKVTDTDEGMKSFVVRWEQSGPWGGFHGGQRDRGMQARGGISAELLMK